MQVRPHPTESSTKRVWLSHEERDQLLQVHSDYPKRQIALLLGLHGLRTVEMLRVTKNHFRKIDGSDTVYKLYIPSSSAENTELGGGNARETPVSEQVYQEVQRYANTAGKAGDESLIDVGKRQVRRWIESAREELRENSGNESWEYLTSHDLRRTWATDTYWSLSFAGIPAAEDLTMSWGGWNKTATGAEIFRQNYLGPVPDHITLKAVEHLDFL